LFIDAPVKYIPRSMKRPLLEMTPSPSHKGHKSKGPSGVGEEAGIGDRDTEFLLEIMDSENDFEDWLDERREGNRAARENDSNSVSSDTSSDSGNESASQASPSTKRVQKRDTKPKSKWQRLDQDLLQP
jgi:hypothetical protein